MTVSPVFSSIWATRSSGGWPLGQVAPSYPIGAKPEESNADPCRPAGFAEFTLSLRSFVPFALLRVLRMTGEGLRRSATQSSADARRCPQWRAPERLLVDQGYGKLRGPSDSETKQRYLVGVGGGLRINLYKNLFGRMEWAYALGEEPLSESDHFRFQFRLQAEV